MLEVGQNFAHFKIVRKLGEGGMGTVYLAEDDKLRRQVALKILSGEFLKDDERRLRFEREARIAASINDPNVMAIHEIGEESSESGTSLGYIVMEFVEGHTLDDHLEMHQPEMPELVRLGEKIASGLAAAHKLGVVHRDIKPANVVVDPDGVPKILDFGVAKPVENLLASDDKEDATMTMAAELTQAGRIVGTVTYMSPEQAQGEPIDTRSDIFAFGILLYRMATGEFPFAGKTSVSVLAKIIEGQHVPPRKQNDEIPPELERILDKCLQKAPDDRYQDTHDLVADLRELRRAYAGGASDVSQINVAPHLAGQGTGANTGEHMAGTQTTNDALAAPGSSGFRRLGLGAVLVAILALAVVFFRGLGGAEVADASESRLAILVFQNKTGDPELDWLQTGLPEILLTDLAQCEGLALISRDRVTDILKMKTMDGEEPSHQDWLSAAKELGATSVLSGSYYNLGDRIRIDARLEEITSGKIILAEKVIGNDPFGLVDDLTLKIAGSLHLVDPTEPESDVTILTTASTDAFKEYLLGQEKLFLGLLAESREHFGSAIEADSTFALAYMRMGMSYIFDGRVSQGTPYFAKAKEFEDKLLPNNRAILDVYNDLWANRDLSKAMTNMEEYVETYPDDREGKAIYGLLVHTLEQDSTKSDTLFSEVLEEDPAYPLGLFLYATTLSGREDFPRAIETMQTYQKYHPESPTSYELLGQYYRRTGEIQKAIASYEEFQGRFPKNLDVVGDLVNLAILDRDFDLARSHVKALTVDPEDHFRMYEAFLSEGTIDVWQGQFLSARKKLENCLAEARLAQSAQLINTALTTLSDLSRIIGDTDSAVHFARELEEHEGPTGVLNRPILAIVADPSLGDEFRPVMRKAVNTFKANIPKDLWAIADDVQDIFDGYAEADTLKLIIGLESLIEGPSSSGGGNSLEVATLHVNSDQFEEAVPHLEELLGSPAALGSGYIYAAAVYQLARCNEALGDPASASEKYEEVLSLWANPDVELEIITDARLRLARLGS